MACATVRDVPAADFIKSYAALLKRTGKVSTCRLASALSPLGRRRVTRYAVAVALWRRASPRNSALSGALDCKRATGPTGGRGSTHMENSEREEVNRGHRRVNAMDLGLAGTIRRSQSGVQR